MRLWLKPDRLAANNLSPQEVLNAVKDHNLEAAPGRLDREVRKLMNIS
jgi:multidrug efflux pump subunit AcrB